MFKTLSAAVDSSGFIPFSLRLKKAPRTARVTGVLFESFCIYPCKRTRLKRFQPSDTCRILSSSLWLCPPGPSNGPSRLRLPSGFSARSRRVRLIRSGGGERRRRFLRRRFFTRKETEELSRGEEASVELLLLRAACRKMRGWRKSPAEFKGLRRRFEHVVWIGLQGAER